jgi:hypothetical protein
MIYQEPLKENLNQFYFADDTHITFTNSHFKGSKNYKKIEFEYLNKWFKANRLSLNFGKTHFM